jgi:hypothetical protein
MESELVSSLIKRQKEGNSLNVIPMEVRKIKQSMNRLLGKFTQQAFTESPHPASAVENNQRVVG